MDIKQSLSLLKNKIIGVLCGGISNEREVSLKSGENVFRILKDHGYRVVLLDLTTKEKLFSLIKDHHIDIIFNVLHGFYGEDGQLQSDLNALNIAYTGCSSESSSFGMNKLWTKMVAKGLGYNTPNYFFLDKGQDFHNLDFTLEFPWFIKPILEGSSRGTYVAHSYKDRKKITLDKDKSYLIESLIVGREVTSGIISYGNTEIILPTLELKSSNEFYDYEAKYTEGKTDFFCPADLPKDVTEYIHNVSLNMHKTLGCKGATRCDFMIDTHTHKAYFLEINTSPGMTKLSDIPMEAKALGMTEIELCEAILLSGLERL